MSWTYEEPREVKSVETFAERLSATLTKLANVVKCHEPVADLPYGTTVRPSGHVERAQLIRVTDGVGFTIANPEHAREGTTITLDIWNNSGGTMGTVTWGSEYSLDGSFTNPINGAHTVVSFTCIPVPA